jgi:Ala-tRNA(Pro) deacylase
MEAEEKVYTTLDDLGIAYETHTHPPVYTVEEANQHWADIEGSHTKNIFLRNKKGSKHYLVIVEHAKKIDIKALQRKIMASTLSFASERRLQKYLGLSQGSVSAFGIINDENNEVEVVVDKDLLQQDKINFHPNVNTATVTISTEDFKKFLDQSGNKVKFIEL